MKIGVAGITGRMGQLVAEEIPAAGAYLVGGTTLTRAASLGPRLFPTIADLAAACDMVIDFTHADAVPRHAEAIARAGVGWILGSTGLTPAGQDAVGHAARHVAVVQAANFSPGVTLLLALAEQLARTLPASQYDAEILEMHHRQKVDAPSGTAWALGEAVASGRRVALRDVAQSGRDGQTGARAEGAIGFASLRGGQVVGEHTLLFAAAGEHISLTHKALDRRVFASGAVRAALWAGGQAPGLYGMRDVLGMGHA